MPQVPVIPAVAPQSTVNKNPLNPSSSTRNTPDTTPDFGRQSFKQAVEKEVQKTGSVSVDFLDKFALSHFDKQAADSPAAWDYAALRQTAQEEQLRQIKFAQVRQLQDEADWITKVGALTKDERSLSSYLSVQLPAYQAQLEAQGTSPAQSQEAANQLKTQVVENYIAHALDRGDWHIAQRVFALQAQALPEPVKVRCANQIRQSFAQAQGQALWEKAWTKNPQPQQAREEALRQLKEPDTELCAAAKQQINQLAQAKINEIKIQQAQLFNELAQADVSALPQLLNVQRVLDGKSLETAQKAAYQAGQNATEKQQAWFVKNYFLPNENIEKSFEKGLCTGRDYFRLRAQAANEKSAENDAWLCRGIEKWMQGQGFVPADITRAKYAVLTCSDKEEERTACWKKIKTLLTC